MKKICLGAAVGAFCYTIYFQFAHPELTQTQLLIENWPCYAVMIGAVVGCYVLKPK